MSDDSLEMTDCLKTARSALEQNLIESTDYDQVKAAFLRAQQIRAGLDAGFIRQDDYEQIKHTFLQSLQGMAVTPSPSTQHAFQTAGRADEQHAVPASAPPTQQTQPGSRQNNRQSSFTSASASAAPNAAQSTAPAQAAPSGPVTAGAATIPADIPKMGGNRPKQPQGVCLCSVATLHTGMHRRLEGQLDQLF